MGEQFPGGQGGPEALEVAEEAQLVEAPAVEEIEQADMTFIDSQPVAPSPEPPDLMSRARFRELQNYINRKVSQAPPRVPGESGNYFRSINGADRRLSIRDQRLQMMLRREAMRRLGIRSSR